MELTKSSPLIQKLFKSINKIGDNICKLNQKAEASAGRAPEIIAALLYAVFHVVISIFHEPWFDEGCAWQIAKCASVRDILFTLPHYEGHPPLWHLVLVPFAKFDCPYEISLMTVSLIFTEIAVILILWKSPFPRVVRLLLPFTYFLFYQYGIIARPYSIMMLSVFLAAVTYKNRNTKPWQFILSLMLLCLSSAYGIVIAGGITIAWLIELFRAEKLRFLTDKKRTVSLLCLLALAVILILEIFPADDTYAVTDKPIPQTNNIIVRLIYVFLALPADICATDTYSYDALLIYTNLPIKDLISPIWISLIIWMAAIYIARSKGTVLMLLIPYSLFALMSVVMHMNLHHVGIALFIFIFWAWITCDNGKPVTFEPDNEIKRILLSLMRIFGAVFMTVSLWWAVSASIHELTYIYGIGRNEARFIIDHNLDDYNIMVGHAVYYRYDENDKITDEVVGYDFNHCNCADNVQAYLDRNIFFNFNDGTDDMAYTLHKIADENDCAELIQKWKEQGAPDILFNPQKSIVKANADNIDSDSSFGSYPVVDISSIYDGIADDSDYTLVYFSHIKKVWKNTYNSYFSEIYVRNDLLEEMGLERVDLT